MSFVRCLRSIHSGAEFDPFLLASLPETDSRPLEMILDLDRLRSRYRGLSWYRPSRRDMWRFGALLPLNSDDPDDAAHIVSLGEGFTPMLEYEDHPLARKVGFRLRVKDEGVPHSGFGSNPTRSFKDRGMAVVVSMARRLGLRKLVVPTQGNAGDSLVAYALAAGVEAVVVAPADTPMPILGRMAAEEKRHASIKLHLVDGTIREAGEVVRERYVPQGYFNVATFQEPGWRIEGKKTFGFELAEPGRPSDPWTVPDVVLYPTGGGTGILGMWKAFAELEALGLIGPERPRIIAVQSAVTNPVVRAFESGARDVEPTEAGETIATGLNVAYSIGHRRVLEILRESGGTALAVNDERILSTLRHTFRTKGWWLCPEGGACLSVLDELVENGLIVPKDDVLAFNTASMEKYLPAVGRTVHDSW